MACKVKRDNAMFFREIRHLGTPVAGIATPTMHKHKSRFSGTVDLIRNRGAIFGKDDMGPFCLCLYRSDGQKQEHQATDQDHQMFCGRFAVKSAICLNDI